MFRNLTLYRLPAGIIEDATELAEQLATVPSVAPDPMKMSQAGFVPAIGDRLVHADDGALLFCLATTEKILPPAVINDELGRRVKDVSEREQRLVGGSERKRIKEQIIDEFLPRAFTRTRRTRGYYDTKAGWLVLDTASRGEAESILAALRLAIGTCPASPPTPAEYVPGVLTYWLREGEPEHTWRVGEECELREPVEGGAIVRARRQDLGSDAIHQHLRDGLRAFALEVGFHNRLSFVLDADTLVIRRLRVADAVMETMGDGFDSIDDERAARFALLHREVASLLESLALLLMIPDMPTLVLDGGTASPARMEVAG